MNTFHDAVHYLYSFISYERDSNWKYSDKTFNLRRFHELLDQLGNPQLQLKTIHVAGSDGKGSVCAMTASVLRAMGYRVGLYVSPHLENIRERISIDGEWISEEAFTHWAGKLETLRKPTLNETVGYATFFELMTAMAFLHFLHRQVDYAVIETGLGGRLDATNVMHPLVSVITHISLEHTDKLGNTLEAIADEKLGITRPDVPVVVGHQDEQLLPHFHRRLDNHSATVIFTDERYRVASVKRGKRYRTIDVQTIMPSTIGKRRTVHIPLFGHYQLQNTVTALAALDGMEKAKSIRKIRKSDLDGGLRNLVWPGRFEICKKRFSHGEKSGKSSHPVTVLDVAHTAKGAGSLRLSLDEVFPDKQRIFVMGFLKGKDIRGMMQSLIRPEDVVIITQAPSPRGESLENILLAMKELIHLPQPIHCIPDPEIAYERAEEWATKTSLIVICGSLYLVGKLRQMILLRNGL
ncbi:MAG: bifunctional folylpolyglutamate synthase/dihydrofolate synthase [Candidatus Omnitrophota bacterium]|jgi:dihydrofolate synthase/folylpolyglutamate synthase|nr:MAG: bifunctional folylpolyglutamate synthase/dihydrofolate synthase [Candidatus Omnitrophota bacterium]